jgi:membrane-associated phospholipid phosphatase
MAAVSARAPFEPSSVESSAQHRRLAWRVPLALAAASVLVLPLDLPIMRWVTTVHLPGSVDKAIRLSEAFSHGFGVVVILIAVFVLDREHRARMPRLVAGTVLGGVLANGLKLLVSRTRPRSFDLHGQILDSFSGFLSLGRLPSVQEGFPSAHAAAGFALAVMLSWSYPAGRTFFFVLAAISGLQRMQSMAHFPSDVLFGAALGCLGAYACLPGGVAGRFLDRLEARRALRGSRDGARSGA